MARAPYSPKLRTQPARWLALVSAIVCESATMDEPSNGGNDKRRALRAYRLPYRQSAPPPPPWDGRSPPYPPAGGGSAPRALWFLTRRAGYLVRLPLSRPRPRTTLTC